MKIKSGFVLHTVGGERVAVAVGERTTQFSGMIRLNETGAFMWRLLESGCTEPELQKALVKEYGISNELAEKAVKSFVSQLSNADVIEK